MCIFCALIQMLTIMDGHLLLLLLIDVKLDSTCNAFLYHKGSAIKIAPF